MPLASMSKVTSICGTPRGAGRQVDELELAQRLVVRRHLALALQHVDLDRRLVVLGGGEHLGAPGRDGGVALDEPVMTPPLVSMPSDSGVTSSSRTSLTSPLSTPAWTAAPMATTSSGLTPLCGLLARELLDQVATAGMRVEPPTRMTWSRSPSARPASLKRLLERDPAALEQVGGQLLELGAGELYVEVQRARRVAVMNGRLIWVCCTATARSWPSRPPPSGAGWPCCRPPGRRRGRP